MIWSALLTLVPSLYFLSRLERVKGVELLAPSSEVCPGERLTLICQTNATSDVEVLQWNINLPERNTTSIRRSIPIVGNRPPNPFIHPTIYGVIVFNFSRASNESTHPLITELLIDSVNVGINGTEISCSKADLSERRTTTVHIIGANPAPPNISKIVPDYQATNFTVSLEWTEENGVSYNVSIIPTAKMVVNRNNIWKLLIIGNYNISYNVSVIATLCDEFYSTTTIILEYVTCEFLTEELLGNSLRINNTESRNPDIHVEGDNITFYCISGDLKGPNRTTCLSNGNWEPDTKEVMCKHSPCVPPSPPRNGYIIFHSSESSVTLNFVCQNSTPAEEVHIISYCNSFGKWAPNPSEFCSGDKLSSINIFLTVIYIGSSLSFFILSLVIILILGCCCCFIYARHKNKQTVERTAENLQGAGGSIPIYEDLLPVPMKSKENELKLEENVAYNSIEIKLHSNSHV